MYLSSTTLRVQPDAVRLLRGRLPPRHGRQDRAHRHCLQVMVNVTCDELHFQTRMCSRIAFQQVSEDVRGVEEGEHGGRGDQPDVG